ncbi:MAG: glycosyl hydrolase [Melioribacteraceae bacterium]|nr:glycosyl hydrolase [Melioribacteraceae bacterium]
MKTSLVTLLLLALLNINAQSGNDMKEADSLKNISLSGLSFRSIGPAVTGGRIRDLAVNPFDYSEYYLGVGDGMVWKTTNSGVTFAPIFDNQDSYAIGSIRIDPTNPNVIWVGTGESSNHNNSGYGDGVYKSEDGGKTWKNLGLKESEHIGGIAIDPKDPNVVYVAAMGPLRRSGSERGIFKTTDGGKNWEHSLKISEYTGCYQVYVDPRYSNIVYAVAQQRMRKLYTGVSGGPESAIYRSTDSGKNWHKLVNGLPTEDIGRTGLAVSPANPDVLYAIIESKEQKGVYKSEDRGASWSKQSSYVSSYPFYFQRLYCDPVDVNRVYSMDVFLQVSVDGGKTWKNLGEDAKHVDNHCMWVNPDNPKHLLVGSDGGLYESFDLGNNWDFKSNLPITEVYKVTPDNAKPFYNVYIGTQDNNSLGGPSRTVSSAGITNQDWYFTVSGDGFETQVDWKDPNIVYSQYQFGGLYRYDKRSGERLYIKPQDFADTAYRFDWDAAILLSMHDNKRLYFGGNKLMMTEDMGSTWKEISPDLTRGVPENMMKLMGRSWSKDDLASKGSMAQIVTIAESPLDENLLFTGSGDGLIYFTEDMGKTWNKSNLPNDFPEYARIHNIQASFHYRNTAYAATHNFHDGDYKPYILKTTDGGKNWFLHNGNLPERGSTYVIAEDHINKNLLFVGTQHGVFFTNDGGKEWIRLKTGIPKMITMDLEIQREENDLVVSTFGRGVYILDDYSPLRYLTKENLNKEAHIFPIKDGLMFVESDPFGFRGVGFMGASFFTAKNPPVGVVFTYYIKDEIKSLKEKRIAEEKVARSKERDIKFPDYETLRKEAEEPEPYLLFTITDMNDNIVRKIKTGISKGVNRIVWDFRYGVPQPISLKPFDDSIPWNDPDRGYMAVPGKYKVSLTKFVDGEFTEIVPPQEFVCKPLNLTTLPADDKASLDEFNKKVAELTRVVAGADAHRKELSKKMNYLKKAVIETAEAPNEIYNELLTIEKSLDAFNRKLNGDNLRSYYDGGVPTAVKGRLDLITYGLWSTTAAPTVTYIRSYEAAAAQSDELLTELKEIDNNIKIIESKLEKTGAPYTPGRIPEWRK